MNNSPVYALAHKLSLALAAKSGAHIYENQVNKLNNLPVTRKDKITIKSIFLNYWDEFISICKTKGKKIRPAILEEVEKMMHCKDLSRGYLFYECPKCNEFYIQGLSCNSRFCPSCGNRYRNDRTTEISKVCINRPHRQFVFSIAKELRPYFLFHRELYDILFQSVEAAFDYLLKNSKIAKREKRDFGYVSFLHTFGRAINDNPHIHVLICDGYMTKDNVFHKYNHFNYSSLRKSFMKVLLDKTYQFLKKNAKEECKVFYKLKNYLYSQYKDGFYAYGPKLESSSKVAIKKITQYIGRYVSHPAIAESRIIDLDYINKTISYYYEPHQDDHTDDPSQKRGIQFVTESVFDFIKKLIRHIPDKGFHLIRYYGFYSNRSNKKKDTQQSLFTNHELNKMKSDNKWIKHISFVYKYNPLICKCGATMVINYELSYFEGTKDG